MTAEILRTERDRLLLSQAIVRALDSWPQLHRRVFTEVHYRGESPESVANDLSLSPEEVRALLGDCEHRLRDALRSLPRNRPAPLTIVPRYALNRCCR